MEILSIIPARGGSKSIPRKNIAPLLGRPLIEYSIEQSLNCNRINRTIVSTDCPEIAEIARRAGAEVPFLRPSEFAQDSSLDIDVFFHALHFLKEGGYQCDWVVHLRPTGPMRAIPTIDRAIDLAIAHPKADTLRSVSRPLQTPYKMWREENGLLQPLLSIEGVQEPFNQPRQSLPQVFWQNGYIDMVRPQIILEHKKMCGNYILPFEICDEIFEIDYPEDFQKIENIMRGKVTPKSSLRHSV